MKLLEAKAQSKALQKSKQLMAEFQAMVSHEIRTPLAAIKGFASSLLQSDVKWSKKEMLDFIREIDAGADRLACIVNDLLEIASLNGNAKKYEKTCQFISQIFEKAERSLQEIAGNRKLVISPAPGLPRVLANPEQIIQVLCNLVDNASKFSPEGSEITIKAVQNGRSATISVTDEGIGISKEEQAKIFDRLYQAKQITYGAKEGTGLGLAICKRIIDQHNGKIWLDSNPGKGSTFYFILPICKD